MRSLTLCLLLLSLPRPSLAQTTTVIGLVGPDSIGAGADFGQAITAEPWFTRASNGQLTQSFDVLWAQRLLGVEGGLDSRGGTREGLVFTYRTLQCRLLRHQHPGQWQGAVSYDIRLAKAFFLRVSAAPTSAGTLDFTSGLTWSK